MAANSAHQSKHRLDEQRRLGQPCGIKVVQIVEMARVVALKLSKRTPPSITGEASLGQPEVPIHGPTAQLLCEKSRLPEGGEVVALL
jgi:hypothetical protein